MQEQMPASTATPSHASTPSADTSSVRHVPETRGGQTDAFSQAFNSAQDDLAKAQKASGPAPDDESYIDDDTPPATSTGAEQPATDAATPAPVTPTAPATLEPPAYWSRERKEAFKFQPRETQEAWLAADPEPNARWNAETKEAFAKLPRDAKELFLSRVTDVERGFNQKLQGLAGERKLAEEIRAAVPEPVRQYMTQHGMTEPQVFARLLDLQQQSATDPAGYLRAFVANNKLDPSQIFGIELPQPGAPLPVEVIQKHPAYQQLATQFAAMQREVQAERARIAEAEGRRFQAEYEQVVQQTDGDGKPLYPYIRLLADPMARIIESESEHFSSMTTAEKLATAYALALEEFPELMPLKRTAAPPKADVPVVKDAHTVAEEKRMESVERALTPKPRTPTPTPQGKGDGRMSIDDAFNAAKKQLGLRG